MKIQDIMTVTELSRVLRKSRPTVYKFLSDYEAGHAEGLPAAVRELFDHIEDDGYTKRDIYNFCEDRFAVPHFESGTLREIFSLLEKNKRILDLEKIKNYIEEEIRHGTFYK